MPSFARLTAALGTAAVLASAGPGFAYADTTPTTPVTYDIGTSSAAPQQPVGPPAATPPPPPLTYDLQTSPGTPQQPAGPPATPTPPPPLTYDLQTSPGTPQQPDAAQPTPSPTPQPTALATFQRAFSNLLLTLGDGTHTDPSVGLVASIQTPPNVAALGRHLVRVYATPEFIENDTELTLSAACPSGGLVTNDPGVRSALPYISRVTNVNVWSSLASGDVGQSSLGVHFTNNSSTNELAAFQFVCSVRD